MSTTVGTLAVHLTADPAEIQAGSAGQYTWLRLGPVTLHSDGSSPEALRTMAAALLEQARHMESAVALVSAA
ncbi:hypothetical protein OHA37_26760 [Streptomyces sp. NBC_00335]|uniref:hypothetical protein n=1 Tax=unclassified Streptomyces TaxID=2593676 RepID=UPI00224FAD9E|nr:MULTISPECIES: hypothetical protein [unclassified Streptomyces]MCX5407451.1 hypothetical protein [Streptomyces sp. NBC_00086]